MVSPLAPLCWVCGLACHNRLTWHLTRHDGQGLDHSIVHNRHNNENPISREHCGENPGRISRKQCVENPIQLRAAAAKNPPACTDQGCYLSCATKWRDRSLLQVCLYTKNEFLSIPIQAITQQRDEL
jgi:hypothetical protein